MKISNSARITLRAAILTGLASHLFALTNVLQNHDNIAVLNGYGAGVTSGRWFLNILGDFIGRVWGNYNLPFFNGLLCILLLSVSAAVIIERFHITDLRLCAAWGGGIFSVSFRNQYAFLQVCRPVLRISGTFDRPVCLVHRAREIRIFNGIRFVRLRDGNLSGLCSADGVPVHFAADPEDFRGRFTDPSDR